MITPSRDYYAMQPENDDNKSAESDIAALSDTASKHYQQDRLQQGQDVCQRILRKEQRPVAILILAKAK
jgi:hypothetical protein